MPERIERVGVFANPEKKDAVVVARRLMSLLEGVEVVWSEELGRALGVDGCASFEELGETDLVITLGGDGTMLLAARKLAPSGVPILGVNLGHLGFLTALLPDELGYAIPAILRGDYVIEERMMLEAKVADSESEPVIGLNEAVVNNGGSPRIIHLTVYVSGCLVSHIGADGIIVSTPTGSTAYSMAASGAILSPEMEAFIITPLAPYTLAIRPLIVGPNDRIEIRYVSGDKKITPRLIVDGQVLVELPLEGMVEVRRADCVARFVKYHRRSFYDILRTKLGWGPPPSAA